MNGRDIVAERFRVALPSTVALRLKNISQQAGVVRSGLLGFLILLASTVPCQDAAAAWRGEPQEIDGVTDTSFDDIKFEMEVGGDFDRTMLTDSINDLVGKKIRIRGYIRPSFQQDGIRQFILVRDNQECCFGPGAALFDCVLVKMEKGKSTSFTVRPVAVEGTFTVKEFEGPDGKLWAIYRMVANRVE